MKSIIVENVRGQWVVDKTTVKAFEEESVGYADGALIEIEVANPKSLCCHPANPALCTHDKVPARP